MQIVTSQWEAAVRGGSSVAAWRTRVEITSYGGELLASSDELVGDMPMLVVDSGDVTVDMTAPIRRSAQIVFVDTDGTFAPDSGDALLANESGNEVRVWCGFRYNDGSEELLPQGVFGFESDDTESPSGDQTVSVAVFDRSRRIRRAKFVRPYMIPAGSNYVQSIEKLLRSRWSDVLINSVPNPYLTPKLTYDEQDDPWDAALDMAAKIGYELYFDPVGIAQLKPIVAPNVNTPITFDYSEGEQATILAVSRHASNEQAFNGVIAVGQTSSNTGTPPRGEAWDTDPASPTYSGYDPISKTFGPSKYGAVPKFISSALLTSVSQCQAAAQAELLNTVGRHEIIQFDAIPNPAHEPRDLVRVTRARAKIDATYELQAYNIPLRLGVMTALTKERRVS